MESITWDELWSMLSENSKIAVNEARQISNLRKERLIDTEHILFGLLKNNRSTAAVILYRYGIRYRETVTEINIMKKKRLFVFEDKKAEPFTRQSLNTIEFAFETAKRLREDSIKTEHFILGLLQQANSLAAKFLSEKGVSYKDVLKEVKNRITERQEKITKNNLFSDNLKKVINLSLFSDDDHLNLNNLIVSNGQFLLGLTDVKDSKAAEILESMGVTRSTIRHELTQKENSYESYCFQVGASMILEKLQIVLRCAAKEASIMKNNKIRTEHFLLGLLEEKEILGGNILLKLGVTREAILNKIGFSPDI